MGPGGAMAGAITGGSLGFLIGASADLAFDDPRLDDFAAALADFVSAVEPYGGKIIETDLDKDDIKALRKGLNVATTAD